MIVVVDLASLIVLGFLGLVILYLCAVRLLGMVRQWLCNHFDHGFRETQKCDAFCLGCGKNLGFIRTYREERAKYRAAKHHH